MTISDTLFPAVRARMQAHAFEQSDEREPTLILLAGDSPVGDIQIRDDGDEATVSLGLHTHFHVNPYDRGMPDDIRAKWIAEQILEFLEHLLSDRVLVWSVRGRSGGYFVPFEGSLPEGVPLSAEAVVWTRQVRAAPGQSTAG